MEIKFIFVYKKAQLSNSHTNIIGLRKIVQISEYQEFKVIGIEYKIEKGQICQVGELEGTQKMIGLVLTETDRVPKCLEVESKVYLPYLPASSALLSEFCTCIHVILTTEYACNFNFFVFNFKISFCFGKFRKIGQFEISRICTMIFF